jgi:FkbH-like protein
MIAPVPGLYWLPPVVDWPSRIKAIDEETDRTAAWSMLEALSKTRLDFIKTLRLDRALQRRFGSAPPSGVSSKAVRLAVLATSTVAHLMPAIRVAALRRGLWLTTYEPSYGQYIQELSDQSSALHTFDPTTVVLAHDAHHFLRGSDPTFSNADADLLVRNRISTLRDTWRQLRATFRCQILQQTVAPIFPTILGQNEHRLPGSPARLTSRINEALREVADMDGIDLLALDSRIAIDGLGMWHDPGLWHRAKQEVSPVAAPLYGELIARLIGARVGRSCKCMVLDLDNTLWGGVIGDDGLEGIVLGQGSVLGEAFAAFQSYALNQATRGVILAVCSKNDETNALSPFQDHPEMVLKRDHISSFVANWQDKPANIRRIAHELNIGLDSLVFVDDNEFERNLVRKALPMVAVPELPDDPALFAACLSDAGYFEGLEVTDEDRERTAQYQSNRRRSAFQAETTDLQTYLRELDMKLIWRRFDGIGRSRILQLINKTNQFNLTTHRYTDQDFDSVMRDPAAFGLQLRLLDRYGDNGIIAIVVGRMVAETDVLLDVWLMSCRVLGRQVEEATFGIIIDHAKALGASSIIGEYFPTLKNEMVREHYGKLGFELECTTESGANRWKLLLEKAKRPDTFIDIVEAGTK